MTDTPRIVAVTATTELLRGEPRVRLNQAYTDALASVGLIPLVVPPLAPARAGDLLDRVDGLLLSGGEDVAPRRYDASAHPAIQGVHDERDAWEIALARAAREHGTPTFAICRGLQVLNVALGGTLVQDIPSQVQGALSHAEDARRHERLHDVEVEPDSTLAAIAGATRFSVNTLHHQSLDRIAPGLRVTARADDGVVEAAEWAGDDWWMLGAQWHPEELMDTPEPWDRALFSAFAAAISAASASAPRR